MRVRLRCPALWRNRRPVSLTLHRSRRSKIAVLASTATYVAFFELRGTKSWRTRRSGQIDTVMQEKRLFPPPKEFAQRARIKSLEEYQELWDEAAADPPKFWADLARDELHWFEPFEQAARLEGAVRPMVCRRQDQCFVQLPRPQSGGRLGQPHGHSLGRRAGRHAQAHVCRAAPRSLQVRECAQAARHSSGRPRVDLHADGAGAGDRDAGLRGSARFTR